jgi:hypothetical protein
MLDIPAAKPSRLRRFINSTSSKLGDAVLWAGYAMGPDPDAWLYMLSQDDVALTAYLRAEGKLGVAKPEQRFWQS